MRPAEKIKETDRTLSHLPDDERAATHEFVRRVKEEFKDNILEIRLYGSKARGDYTVNYPAASYGASNCKPL